MMVLEADERGQGELLLLEHPRPLSVRTRTWQARYLWRAEFCAATQDHPCGHGCRSSRVWWLRL